MASDEDKPIKVIGIDGMTRPEILRELDKGARFAVFESCFSLILLTVVHPSDVYFFRAGEKGFIKSLPATFISLLCGWWGFPFGPIRTVMCIINNFRGGREVTNETLAALPLTLPVVKSSAAKPQANPKTGKFDY